jgi:hypothetical protein
MRARASKDGLTLRVITGSNNVLLAMDLADAKRKDCLGFSIERLDVETGERRWLPNLLRFPSDGDRSVKSWTTARAPLQKFRWGDYTVDPGRRYRYRVVARYEALSDIIRQGIDLERRKAFDMPGGVSVEVRTENNHGSDGAVFFNRGAAASSAYVQRYGSNDFKDIPDAKWWLSRGLEEAAVVYMAQALDSNFALHAAVYEFQKPELLEALSLAKLRGVDVSVVYHGRQKMSGGEADDDDNTTGKNQDAITAAKIDFAKPRKADPQGAIMHNKFVVLLKKGADGKLEPVAVWTGSTNWTEGAIYGQLNVGHAVYDPQIAGKYEAYFQLLHDDLPQQEMRKKVMELTPVPANRDAIPHGVTPIVSPQSSSAMIDLYASVCSSAKVLLISAPFSLHETIRATFPTVPPNVIRFLLLDKERSAGKPDEVSLIKSSAGNQLAVATALKSPLFDFQGNVLQARESFHHKGIHIHSKIICADPFGPDPVLVTGSANFSDNSTRINDSNSLIIRGDTAVADIYTTEFMRMFEHYWFRAHMEEKAKTEAAGAAPEDRVLGLKEDNSWTDKYYEAGSREMLDRCAFLGLAS